MSCVEGSLNISLCDFLSKHFERFVIEKHQEQFFVQIFFAHDSADRGIYIDTDGS
jgi:hypothetical protein